MAKQKLVKKNGREHGLNPSTPFGKWLVDYAVQNDTTLVAMARDAGLGPGTLYKYVEDPPQKPALSVIVRLSEYTGKPTEQLAKLAGVAGYKPQESFDPGLEELTGIYKRLPKPMKGYLLTNARQLADSVNVMGGRSSRKKKPQGRPE